MPIPDKFVLPPVCMKHPVTPELRTFYPRAVWIVHPGKYAILYGNSKDGASTLTTVDHGWGEQSTISEVLATAEMKFLAGVKE